MPKSVPALALAAMLAVGHCWTVGTGYRADMGMQLVNGSCLFENITIPAGESLRQESPCRRVTCIEHHKTVFIQDRRSRHHHDTGRSASEKGKSTQRLRKRKPQRDRSESTETCVLFFFADPSVQVKRREDTAASPASAVGRNDPVSLADRTRSNARS
ncbi:hypothetical protein HPB50_006667 [Hyalomma asiaticum]|uniref:Uncharacterized protein n=1 Tax=Hyalomma asiaticum TaxID=266040 RepID=A0ACB7TD44_HYAAI|nr:hypothetical protein HPB50_006667 [Hyalomma asiaticum]